MKLNHEFALPVGVAAALQALADPDLVASCLPGAVVESRDGETINGSIVVKVGPMRFQYRGTGQLVVDAEAGTLTLTASAVSVKDAGDVQTSIRMVVTGDESSSHVQMETDLALTGRAAQFGGMVLRDVSNAMVKTFTKRLVATIAAPNESVANDELTSSSSANVGAAPGDVPAGLLDVLPFDRKVLVGAGVGLLSMGLIAMLGRGRGPRIPAVLPVVIVRIP